MRKTGQNGLDVLNASGMLLRGARLAAVAAGIAVVLSSGVARAQDAKMMTPPSRRRSSRTS